MARCPSMPLMHYQYSKNRCDGQENHGKDTNNWLWLPVREEFLSKSLGDIEQLTELGEDLSGPSP